MDPFYTGKNQVFKTRKCLGVILYPRLCDYLFKKVTDYFDLGMTHPFVITISCASK